MKNFILILFCMSASVLDAQTPVVKKHPNGMWDTVWHIRNLDTFLIESYRPNGTLESQTWRKDSTYSYDNHKNIIGKNYYLKNKDKKLAACPDYELYEFANEFYKKQVFFPNGKLAQHAEKSGDTLLQKTYYDVDGRILKQKVFRKTQPFIFEWIVQNEESKMVSIVDTLHLLLKTWTYNEKGQLSSFLQRHINPFDYTNKSNFWIQYIEYDSLGKKYFEWNLDSNQVIPFKDNGLCLYGFVNLKGDTILPAQYEGVNNVGTAFTTRYIVHTATQYSVLDAFGNATIAPHWTFLEPFKTHERNERNDSILEQTYLRCRTKTGFGIIRLNGQIVLQPVYQDIRKYKKDLFEVKIGGSWGIVDINGQWIVKPLYPHLEFTQYPDLYLVEETVETDSEIQERYSLIRQDGQVLLNSTFKEIKPISKRTFLVESFQEDGQIGKMGIFHAEKGWIYDTLYRIEEYRTSYLSLINFQTERTALIDIPTMQPILPLQYDVHRIIVSERWNETLLEGVQKDTFAIIKKDNKFGLFDPQNQKWMMSLEYDYLNVLDEMDSLFATLKNGVWAVRNAKGQIIDNQIYTDMGNSSSGYFGQRGDSVLFFKHESFPVPESLEEVFETDEKLVLLKTFDDKTLLINSLHKIVVPIEYEIVSLEGDYAVVHDTVRNIQYLTDHKGEKMVLLPQFKVLQMNIAENVIIVLDSTTQQLGAIRKNGDFILKSEYFAIFPLDSAGVIWAKKEASPPLSGNQWLLLKNENLDYERDTIHDSDKGWAMYDKTGRLLTNTLFEYAFEWHDSVGIGMVHGKFGLWHASGKNLVPPNYDKIWYDVFSKIYYLFEFQTLDNPLVGFANGRGQIIADGLFKKMSAFNKEYAFVETAQGLGIVSKTGKYLVEPKPYSIQQSVLNLMPLMDSLRNSELYRAKSYDFQVPFDEDETSDFKTSFNSLSIENQLLIHNLLMEYISQSYFLQGKRIHYDRSTLGIYDISGAVGEWRNFPQYLNNSLITQMPHIEAVKMTPKYINFLMHEDDFRTHRECFQRIKIQKSLNFKRVNDYWEKIGLDNVLNINDKNNNLFLKLFTQKLSALKDVNLDCSDPSKYVEMIKDNFYVLEEGMQFQLETQRSVFYEVQPVSISFSWAELKPFLN